MLYSMPVVAVVCPAAVVGVAHLAHVLVVDGGALPEAEGPHEHHPEPVDGGVKDHKSVCRLASLPLASS